MNEVLNKDAWQGFLEQCLACETQAQLSEFFALYLTISEKSELANRFAIIQELLKGNKSQREIASSLKVSLANVSRGSNALKVMRLNKN
jgi:TrpR family trp operon transcriptional repressor